MAKKGKVHNIRDIFPNTNLLEGATISQSPDDGKFNIEGFTIIKAGLSANGNYYSAQTLREAGKKGVFSGKAIRTDHVDITASASVHDVVGKIEKTWFNEETQSLRGSGFLSSTADDLVTKVKEGLIGDLSINAIGVTQMERYSGDKLRRNVKEIRKGFSVDLVCEAAAGGTLHEEFQRNKELCERMRQLMDELEKLTLEELKEARPDLVAKIEESAKPAPKDPSKSVEDEKTKPLTATEVSGLVTKAITAHDKSRDELADKKDAERVLLEGLQVAVSDTMKECGAADSVKGLIERSMLPFAVENFKTVESVDKTKLAAERDRLLADFSTLVKEHTEYIPPVKDGVPAGKEEMRLVDLMIV